MNKEAQFVQSGPATTAPRATGPFQFTAGVDGGSATNPTPPNTLVLPNNAGTRTLIFTGESWEVEQAFATRAAMDAAFPNGTYVLNLGGRAINVPLTGDLYPNVPVATITGGTFSNGVLMVDRATPLTITINFTQNYLAGRSRLGINVDTSSGQGVNLDAENDFTASTLTLTVPANTFGAGGSYQINLEANRIVTLDITTVPGSVVVGAYSNRVQVPVSVSGPPAAPNFTQQPVPQSVTAGSTVVFSANANNATSYQWRRNGVAIAGQTNRMLVLTGVDVIGGQYSVVATNASGSTTSNNAQLSVLSTTNFGRLINLSILSSIRSPGDSFTLGYVVGGTTGAKPLVIRAAGPSLGALGVDGTLADPKLELFAGSTKTGENDNWGGSSEVTAAMASVGAFSFTGATSLDAAVAANIETRNNSVTVSAAGTGTGAVIAEIYDASPSTEPSATIPRLINVSVLKVIDPGTTLTAGFVLRGSSSRTVLVRAIGPGLQATFGMPDTMADPQLTLNGSSGQIARNDNWGGDPAIVSTGAAVGAFAIASATSRDAMLLMTLQPGDYTAQVSGVAGGGGNVIVEIYEVP